MEFLSRFVNSWKGLVLGALVCLVIGNAIGNQIGNAIAPQPDYSKFELSFVTMRLPGYLQVLSESRGDSTVVKVPFRFVRSLANAVEEPNYSGLYTERSAFKFIPPTVEGDRWWYSLEPGYFVVRSDGKGNYEFLDSSRFCSQQEAVEPLCRTFPRQHIVLRAASPQN